MDISQFLKGRSLKDLSSEELFTLDSVLQNFQKTDRLQTYKSILQEGLTLDNFTSADSLEVLQEIRSHLGLSEEEHYKVLSEISSEQSFLLYGNQNSNPHSTNRKKFPETKLGATRLRKNP